jgi:hypothetical protein
VVAQIRFLAVLFGLEKIPRRKHGIINRIIKWNTPETQFGQFVGRSNFDVANRSLELVDQSQNPEEKAVALLDFAGLTIQDRRFVKTVPVMFHRTPDFIQIAKQ